MAKKIQSNIVHPNNNSTAHSKEKQSIAERYLDLWQDNIRHWATDPAAMEKWLADIVKKQTKT